MTNANIYSVSSSVKISKNITQNNFSIFKNFKAKIGNLGNTIIASIVAGKEPKIWLSFDQQGNRYWNAYDPQSHRSVKNLSETEMRVWLEERY